VDLHSYFVSESSVLVHNLCKPNTVKSAKGVEGDFSVDGYRYRIDTNKVAPGEGGFHLHITRDKVEVAKVAGTGSFASKHKNKSLLKPSEINKTVRREINQLVRYVTKELKKLGGI